MINKKPKTVVVECPNCHKTNSLENSAHSRKDASNPQITEVGIICKSCGHFTRAYRTNKDLEDLRKRLHSLKEQAQVMKTTRSQELYEEVKAEYGRQFEALNHS